MKKITVILGTRPEAIKLLPLVDVMRRRNLAVSLISTSQHSEMLDSVFDDFGIYPDISLSYFPSESMLRRHSEYCLSLERELLRDLPDGVIVQGDTLSAYSGALTAYLSGIPVYHVEAGLRTYDIYSPYPEEFIRRSIAAMTYVHFAPDNTARINLLCEGVQASKIFVTGNTVLDAIRQLAPTYAITEPRIVFTMHRRESEEKYGELLSALGRFAVENPGIEIIYPRHPRLKFQKDLEKLKSLPNIIITEPLSPRVFYSYLASSAFAVTDSGGISEECAALGIEALIIREKTERCEQVQSGKITLVGASGSALYSALTARISAVSKKKRRVNIKASPAEKISDIISSVT